MPIFLYMKRYTNILFISNLIARKRKILLFLNIIFKIHWSLINNNSYKTTRFHKLKCKKKKNRKVDNRLKNRRRKRKLLPKSLVKIFQVIFPRTLEKKSARLMRNSVLPSISLTISSLISYIRYYQLTLLHLLVLNTWSFAMNVSHLEQLLMINKTSLCLNGRSKDLEK